MEENAKICTRCKIPKVLSLFSMHTAAADKKQSQCKSCVAERARLKRVGTPCISCGNCKEKGVPKGARLCLSCSATCYECKAQPRQKQHRLCAVCQAKKDKIRKSSFESKFADKITRIASNYKVFRPLAAVLAATTICHACGAKSIEGKKMHVDHCHETNDVRGVLCFTCNVALGNVQDSIARLEKLIFYLRDTETVKKLKDLEKAKHFIELLLELEVPR